MHDANLGHTNCLIKKTSVMTCTSSAFFSLCGDMQYMQNSPHIKTRAIVRWLRELNVLQILATQPVTKTHCKTSQHKQMKKCASIIDHSKITPTKQKLTMFFGILVTICITSFINTMVKIQSSGTKLYMAQSDKSNHVFKYMTSACCSSLQRAS